MNVLNVITALLCGKSNADDAQSANGGRALKSFTLTKWEMPGVLTVGNAEAIKESIILLWSAKMERNDAANVSDGKTKRNFGDIAKPKMGYIHDAKCATASTTLGIDGNAGKN